MAQILDIEKIYKSIIYLLKLINRNRSYSYVSGFELLTHFFRIVSALKKHYTKVSTHVRQK